MYAIVDNMIDMINILMNFIFECHYVRACACKQTHTCTQVHWRLLIASMFQPVGSVHKRGRKCHEDGTLNLVLRKQVDYSTCGALETDKKSTRQGISLGHRRKRVVSPNTLGSNRACSKGFNKDQEYGVSISSEATLEKGKSFSSSCSVT